MFMVTDYVFESFIQYLLPSVFATHLPRMVHKGKVYICMDHSAFNVQTGRSLEEDDIMFTVTDYALEPFIQCLLPSVFATHLPRTFLEG